MRCVKHVGYVSGVEAITIRYEGANGFGDFIFA